MRWNMFVPSMATQRVPSRPLIRPRGVAPGPRAKTPLTVLIVEAPEGTAPAASAKAVQSPAISPCLVLLETLIVALLSVARLIAR
jgi:hypothetical protein